MYEVKMDLVFVGIMCWILCIFDYIKCFNVCLGLLQSFVDVGMVNDEVDSFNFCELCYFQEVLVIMVIFVVLWKQCDGYYYVVSSVGEGVFEIR